MGPEMERTKAINSTQSERSPFPGSGVDVTLPPASGSATHPRCFIGNLCEEFIEPFPKNWDAGS